MKVSLVLKVLVKRYLKVSKGNLTGRIDRQNCYLGIIKIIIIYNYLIKT